MTNTTWSPTDKSSGFSLSNGNLTATNVNNAICGIRAAHGATSGKYYWEVACPTLTYGNSGVGVCKLTWNLTTYPAAASAQGLAGTRALDGRIAIDAAWTANYIGAAMSGTLTCIAVDCDKQLIWFRLGASGNWNGSATANPATGVGGIAITTGNPAQALYPAAWTGNTNDQVVANFGDSAFTGAVPSGFTAGFPASALTTNAVVTQAVVENWVLPEPAASVTQVVLEEWMSSASTTVQCITTMVVLEEWMSVKEASRNRRPQTFLIC